MSRPTTLLAMADFAFADLFDDARIGRLSRAARLTEPFRVTGFDDTAAERALAEAEVLVTGWGCPPLTEPILARAPRLRAVLHAAGTIKDHITPACWERGLLITSAAEANAIPVAEYTLAAILFAGKQVPLSAALSRNSRTYVQAPGPRSNHHRTVGVIGYSRIGRRVADMLRPFDFRVLVADPYAHPQDVARAGARLVELDELLRVSDIVSLHAPSTEQTHHLLDAERLAAMPHGATLINTARGLLVDTAALTSACLAGRLNAILDVTEPEPLNPESPLWDLPNVMITPHVAGSLDSEVHRLADSALDELERLARGDEPRFPVFREELARIA